MLFCAELPEYKAQECDRGKEQLEAELVGDEIFNIQCHTYISNMHQIYSNNQRHLSQIRRYLAVRQVGISLSQKTKMGKTQF